MSDDTKALKSAVHALAHYFWVEMGWENFRAEFLGHGDPAYRSQRASNAAAIARLLDRVCEDRPEVRYIIMEAKRPDATSVPEIT